MESDENRRRRVEQALREAIGVVLPTVRPGLVTGDKHLRDLGADSVDRIEIILEVTTRLGVRDPMSSFSDIPDIDALVDRLSQAVRA
ncbi:MULTISPECIES: acyl carrier protein [Streptomyces]|uniref:Carrier domain-containing protein n=3 Tax=Streptomyces TaxID=1883 RepID=A0A8H9LGS1_9ACTN|nr:MULTISPECIES: acyl carrier protein [Streptomyces]MDQ0292099.1 polyketide biosynthesis acyl carrier protein [Streptomyces sp. DSM 41037]RPK88343.1 acyl carrier protein [Streptomyces sp. ADI98-12]WPR54395.1 acyl carrier protein [Streptomyces sp. S399]WSU34473.1 acyl carrier protein [Streptomyces gougerotii]SUP60645.1 acyl carrier protein [Streptomyces griseus]